ncbi:MAG: hypothetical protein LBP19_05245 [Treponema sp.]|jgi:hypothetical protein|nr:hypothetical protein [Treponema sp.]
MTRIFKSFANKSPITRGKKRYLCGVATGLKQDVHGERMSGNCIRSIIRQSKEKDILLFPDEHGIRESEDIGILHNLKQLPNGDIYVEFRLYDDTDSVDARSIETANKLWAQSSGLPPYTRPREKGFSIEGYIPEDRKDLEDKRENEGIIDDMKVEGFVVVPEPAYENSVIQTVEKSKHTTKERNVAKKVQKSISPEEEDLIQNIDNEIKKLSELVKQHKSVEDDIVEADDEGDDVPPEEEHLDDVEKTEEEEVEDESAFDDFEEEEVEKKKVKKSETARASAEEKIDTLTEEDERALQVLKSLMGSVRKARRVPEETVKYFNETHKVLKSAFTKINQQQQRIDQLESAVEGMLEGMGISQKLLQTGTRKKVQKSRLSPDAQAIVEALGSVIQKSARTRGEVDYSADMGRDGTLGDVMNQLFNN